MSKAIREFLERRLAHIWYEGSVGWVFLYPFSLLFCAIAALRKTLFQHGIKNTYRADVPVIVVGNITVGGVGKTPMVIYLAELLMLRGMKPGIVTRGYGGNSQRKNPTMVNHEHTAADVGDEALLMYQRLGIPVCVGANRGRSARRLSEAAVDVIISDDGLQHYALKRDIEIAVIDGERQFGNGHRLPAGPLREPVSRLSSVDIVITHRASCGEREQCMNLQEVGVFSLDDSRQKKLAHIHSGNVHAVAGIGNPQRFFETLRQAGLRITEHAFSDHYRYTQRDFAFAQGDEIIMTEKDAVKCRQLNLSNAWYLRVIAQVSKDVESRILSLVARSLSTETNAGVNENR